jgi:hypothetical protein
MAQDYFLVNRWVDRTQASAWMVCDQYLEVHSQDEYWSETMKEGLKNPEWKDDSKEQGLLVAEPALGTSLEDKDVRFRLEVSVRPNLHTSFRVFETLEVVNLLRLHCTFYL